MTGKFLFLPALMAGLWLSFRACTPKPASLNHPADPAQGSTGMKFSPGRLGILHQERAADVDDMLDSLVIAKPAALKDPAKRITLISNWADADTLFLSVLTERLGKGFGYSLAVNAPETLTVGIGGTLSHTGRGPTVAIDSAIPVRPLIPPDLDWDLAGYVYMAAEPEYRDGRLVSPPVWDIAPFPTLKPGEVATQDQKIRYALEVGLPKAFATGDTATLRRVFTGIGECILVGKVHGNVDQGKETAEYRWETADGYLDKLEAQLRKGTRFRAGISVMKVYRDLAAPNRFWAIARQSWDSKLPGRGRPYHDDGFLLVKFDMGKLGSLVDFQIAYKLWFHNYRARQFETNIERWERLRLDIVGVLTKGARLHGKIGRLENGTFVEDPGVHRLSEVDSTLVMKMGYDLTEAVRKACCAEQAKESAKPIHDR